MTDRQKFRTMDWVVGTATTIALALCSYLLFTTKTNTERIIRLESEQREPPRWVEDKFNALSEQVADLKLEFRDLKNEIRSGQSQ